MWKSLLALFIARAGEATATILADTLCEALKGTAQQRGCGVDDIVKEVITKATGGAFDPSSLEK